jgi:hypothetical protein
LKNALEKSLQGLFDGGRGLIGFLIDDKLVVDRLVELQDECLSQLGALVVEIKVFEECFLLPLGDKAYQL